MTFKNSLQLFGLISIGILSACGGGGGGSTSVPANDSSTPVVSAITSSAVMYSKTSKFTVSGTNLDKSTVTATDSCTGLAEQAGGSATSRTFACTPSAVGTVTLTAAATTGGAVLKQVPFTVPKPQVTMTTSKGNIVLELDPAKAPITVNNFLQYVNDGFYGNTIFHRVISGFVVQGGGFGTDYVQKPTRAAIALEAPATTKLSNVQGSIAMARTSDLNSATSQFFFNTVNNSALDTAGGGYAVFGNVVQGMSTVQTIEAVPVSHNSTLNADDVPTTMVTLTSAAQTL